MTLTADQLRSAEASDPRAPLDHAADKLRVVSLFSGIAGLDSGLEQAGAEVVEMCELWEPARRVLRDHYPDVPIAADVTTFLPMVPYDLLAAGFPCTDLSHVGRKAGIFGPQSGLVEHVFRIADETRPGWLLLENVPHLLTLHKGAGVAEITRRLEELGYAWAYRTVDSRFTGVPQRRYRVIILASAIHDPTLVILGEDADTDPATSTESSHAKETDEAPRNPHGFYWTEGRYGLGLVEGAIPTLKGGSLLGAPSAPAIWFPDSPRGRKFVLPAVEDAEQLQGFPRGWTRSALVRGERDLRWKLLGNAVTTGVGRWIGERLAHSHPATELPLGRVLRLGSAWPKAATGGPDRQPCEVVASAFPRRLPMTTLEDIVDAADARPLSHRATRGFLSRVENDTKRDLGTPFFADLEEHLASSRESIRPLPDRSWVASAKSRARMQAQRQRDTKPELAMRREFTALGLRYQLQRRPAPDLRSRLDIVFKGVKVAVDIRGCFWHSCPQHGTSPKPNAERWAEKLRRNRERDDQMVADLTARGWIVCVVWEHDNPAAKAAEIAAIVRVRRASHRPGATGRRSK